MLNYLHMRLDRTYYNFTLNWLHASWEQQRVWMLMRAVQDLEAIAKWGYPSPVQVILVGCVP